MVRTTIESNMFHNVAANGACEQKPFDGQRMLYTMSHPPTAVTAIKARTLMDKSK
jgi:hypothetical protein